MTATDSVLAALAEYQPRDGADATTHARILAFVNQHPQPFSRAHLHAHLTGSAIVVSACGTKTLLGHHRKLGMWLQLGGHGEETDASGLQVALREATEESGIAGIAIADECPGLLDLDIHEIPTRGDVPTHLHLDLRYLLRAPQGAVPRADDAEHFAVRWFEWHDALALAGDDSLRRTLQRALDALGRM